MFHFTARDHSRWSGGLPYEVFPGLSQIARYGYLGVHLFFVISGFVILTSAWRRSGREFVASRVSRLYPAYWLAVLLTAVLRAFWPGFEARSFQEVLVNLTMLQDPLGVPRVDGVYWTLWVELQFYVLMLLFIRIGLTLRRVLVVAAVAPVLTVALTLVGPHGFARLTLVEWLPLFCAGMVISVIFRLGHSRAAWAVLGLDVAAAAMTAAVKTTAAIDRIASGSQTSPALIAGGVALCVAVVAVAALVPLVRQVDWRVFTLLGILTYPLYLTHEYVGWAAIEILSPHLSRTGTLVLVVAICLAVATLVHVVAERPCQRPLRRGVERLLGVRRASDPGTAVPDPEPL